MRGLLVLENGVRFKGDLLGSAEGIGELVFNTGMTCLLYTSDAADEL